MKIIHFDCYKNEEKYQKKKNHIYVNNTLQKYLEKNERVKADIITGFIHSKFNRENLEKIQGLKMMITRSAGTDHIDKEYCDSNNIKWKNIIYSSHNVAHHTISLILFFTRSLNSFNNFLKKGKFCDRNINCFDLKNKTLGIIGYGRIGKQVGELAKAFGMNILIYDRKSIGCSKINNLTVCDLNGLLKNSDIITLHCDANPSSIGMIKSESIKKMKEGVILINTSRGCIINENDLIKNINKFSFVGLDVLCNEKDFSKKHPFLKHKNIFITPHIAYKSEETTKERWNITYKHIEDFN